MQFKDIFNGFKYIKSTEIYKASLYPYKYIMNDISICFINELNGIRIEMGVDDFLNEISKNVLNQSSINNVDFKNDYIEIDAEKTIYRIMTKKFDPSSFNYKFIINYMIEKFLYDNKSYRKTSATRSELRKVFYEVLSEEDFNKLSKSYDDDLLSKIQDFEDNICIMALNSIDDKTINVLNYKLKLASSDVFSGFISIDKIYQMSIDDVNEDIQENDRIPNKITIWCGTILGARSIGEEQQEFILSRKKHVLEIIDLIIKNDFRCKQFANMVGKPEVSIRSNGDIFASYTVLKEGGIN